MNFKHLIIIITLLLLIIAYIYDTYIINKKVETFINHTDNDLSKANNLELKDKKYISIKSIKPKNYNLGIDIENSIDFKIANYFKNNILPYNNLLIKLNNNLIDLINNNRLDLAFVREYKLIEYNNLYPNNNIRVLLPLYEKYIIVLAKNELDIEYIDDLNEQYFNTDYSDDIKNEINICYINDDDFELIQIIIKLQYLLPEIKNKINYKKIRTLADLKDLNSFHIFLGLIYPNNIENIVNELNLKPVFYIPKNRIMTVQQRKSLNINININDQNLIDKFHYELKKEILWLLNAEIYLTVNIPLYRTYRIRYLMICHKNTNLGNKNIRTLINNWYMHKNVINNIYNIPDKIQKIAKHKYSELAAIHPKLQFYDEIKTFLINNKLLKII